MANRQSAPQILLTGFEPFGGDAVNPSQAVAVALHGELIGGARVHALVLPCVFGEAVSALEMALRRRPVLVLALGLAASRDEVSIERVAINVDDARIADNVGAQPIDEPVIAGAPAAYFSTLPVKAIVAALRNAGLPAAVSQTAGTYVCNHVFFALMHRLRRRAAVRAGFIHLPALASAGAGLTMDRQVLAVRLALATALGRQHDLRESGGALD